MDDAVIAGMAKWPNVPDCYGWLHLDAHGRWRLGELGSATPPSVVEHEGLKSFINRNYLAMPNGAWALQNGPQRVWVTLALAPLIVRLHDGVATAHTGQVVNISAMYLSDDGVVYFATDAGAAALQSASVEAFSQGVCDDAQQPTWQITSSQAPLPLMPVAASEVESILGFTRRSGALPPTC